MIYDGDLKALFLRNETMPEDRVSYADFKASVLKDVRDYSVNVNELPNDMPIVLTTRE